MRLALLFALTTGCAEYGINHMDDVVDGPENGSDSDGPGGDGPDDGDSTDDTDGGTSSTGGGGRLDFGLNQLKWGSTDELVYTSDEDLPGVHTGIGITAVGPELEIVPSTYAFTEDFVGCGDELDVTLRNIGSGPLVIFDLDYVDPDFQLSLASGLSLPVTLAPDEETSVVVGWDPTFEVLAQGRLDVTSNDPRVVVSATQQAEATFATVTTDMFTAPIDPPVDILFAVDQSCSMDGHAAQLTTAFDGLITEMSQVTNGWSVGVATQDDGCFNSGVFTSSTPDLTTTFGEAVTVGDQDTVLNTEKLFLIALDALENTAAGGCNDGFLRANALLHIVFVSDEWEQGDVTAADFVTLAGAYKSRPTQFKASGILCDPTCSHDDGTNGGYIDAVALTGGIHLDVMSTDWGTYAEQLAAASLVSINTFRLSQHAGGASIRVWVEGTEWTTGWHYDPATNEIVFDTAPPQGASIKVEYGVLMNCD